MTARNGASRRQILKVAGVSTGAALAAVVGPRVASRPVRTEALKSKEAKEATQAPAQAATVGFLADLHGRKLGPYAVQSIGEIERGGVPVILETAKGETFRVDVLRADPFGSPGIGVTSSVSVFLRNGGDGRTVTDEERGLGAMALAKELARRNRKGEKPPAALLTMSERAALDAVS